MGPKSKKISIGYVVLQSPFHEQEHSLYNFSVYPILSNFVLKHWLINIKLSMSIISVRLMNLGGDKTSLISRIVFPRVKNFCWLEINEVIIKNPHGVELKFLWEISVAITLLPRWRKASDNHHYIQIAFSMFHNRSIIKISINIYLGGGQ